MSASAKQEEIRTLDELIEEFKTAMLITKSLDGMLRARPMRIAEHAPGGSLTFATRTDDEKLDEILQAPEVAVAMQSDDRYLSISGYARLETNQDKIDELWSPSWKLWFPEGSTDPHLCLIVFEPTIGEYWDHTGVQRLEFLWEASKALLSGETPDEENLDGHGKVRLA